MLGSQQPRRTVFDSGVSRCRYVLYCVVVFLLVFLQHPVICDEAQCTKSTLTDHLRKSFKVLKLGRTRNIKSCINLCCSKRNCDLALLRRTRCYGISCSHHDLCRGIMNGLREKRHEISKRSILDTDEVPSDFSHRPRYHGFCRHRRVVPHHVFLDGGRGVSRFRKLATDVSSSKECNKYCCQRTDCSLAFIMRDKCYGVICPDDGDCESGEETRVPLHLEIALLKTGGEIVETGKIVDSDMDKESSFKSERRHHHHHHHHHHQEDSNKDSTKYDEEHETLQPKTHHLQDTTISRNHHHRLHKSTFDPESRESHRHSASHHKKKYHRHDHKKKNIERAKPTRIHHHHHRKMETIHDGGRDLEAREEANEDEDKDNSNLGHQKHDTMNSFASNEEKQDEEDKNQDEENDNSNRDKGLHKPDTMNSFASNEDEKDRNDIRDEESDNSDRDKSHHRHDTMNSFASNKEKQDEKDKNQDEENDYSNRDKSHHKHDTMNSFASNEDEKDRNDIRDEESDNSDRDKSHHRHDTMNSFASNEDEEDEKDDNKDEENDISTRHKMKKSKHHKHAKMDFMEDTGNERDRNVSLKKKQRKRLRHKVGKSSKNNDVEEQSGSDRRKKGRPLKHHHHEDEEDNNNKSTSEDNNDHEGASEDNNDHKGTSEDNNDHEDTPEDNEHEGTSNDNNDHKDTSEDNNDHEDISEDNDHEGTSDDNNDHKSTSEDNNDHKGTSEDNNNHKDTSDDNYDSKRKSGDNEHEGTSMNGEDIMDKSDNDAEETVPEKQNSHDDSDQNEDEDNKRYKTSRKSKHTHSKVEFDKKEDKRYKKHHHGGRKSSSNESRNRENENESNEERSKKQNYNHDILHDEVKQQTEREESIENHRSRHKTKNKGKDKHHNDEGVNEDDQMDSNVKENTNDNEMKHKRKMHRKNEQKKKLDYDDENDENTNDEMKKRIHRRKKVDYNHHLHHYHHQEDNVQDQNNKYAERNDKKKKEEHAMNSDVDKNEMEDGEMNEHRHPHNKTKTKHQEKIKDQHRKVESDEQEYSGSGDTSDTENIMSQDHEVDKSNNSHKSKKYDTHDNHDSDGHDSSEDKSDVRDHDSFKDEDDKSSEKKSKDVYKNKKSSSREKEQSKIDNIEDKKNSGDKGDKSIQEDNHVKGSESYSKSPVHHESDKYEKGLHENVKSNNENTTKKRKFKESVSKKSDSKTSKTEQDYDVIHDDDSKEDSKNSNKEENSNTKDKDESAGNTDTNETFKNDKNSDKTGSKHIHYNKEKASNLPKENSHNSERNTEDNSSKKMNKKHGDSKGNEHHVENETKYNSSTKNTKHDKTEKDKQKLDSSQNAERKNAKHHRKSIKHKSNDHHQSKEHYGERNKHTDDRGSNVDNSADNATHNESKDITHDELIHKHKEKGHHAENLDHEANHNDHQRDRENQSNNTSEKHGYKSKDTMHNKLMHNDKGKLRVEKLHHDVNENHDDDQSNRESQNEDDERERSKPNHKNFNDDYEHNDRRLKGIHKNRADHENIKEHRNDAYHHFDNSDNNDKDHKSDSNNSEKERENFDSKENENQDHGKFNNENSSENRENNGNERNDMSKTTSENEDHKKNKSNEIKNKDARVITSDHDHHVDNNRSYRNYKSKNDRQDNSSSGDDQRNNKSGNENRKEIKTNKTEDKDTDEIKDDVDHKEEYEEHKINNNVGEGNARDDQWKVIERKKVKNKDIDGNRRDGIDHVTPSHVVKTYAGVKNNAETTKDEKSSSMKSTKENRMKHSGRETDDKSPENEEENHHGSLHYKIGNMKNNNNTSPSEEKTIIPFEERSRNFKKTLPKKDDTVETRRNGTDVNEHTNHKNFVNNKFNNKVQHGHEPKEITNEKKKLNGEETESSNKTPKMLEPKNRNSRKNIGKSSSGEINGIKDNNRTSDTPNTGYPIHKPQLYHSLKNLIRIKNDTVPIPKEETEEISPEVNNANDIMKSNQNYTASENPKKTEESEVDKTKFFNQETKEWKESLKGDSVDEGGKYFNQRTRDWSVNQPKTNTEYFHNLTSQWNLQNNTKVSDSGKYFNQRTKTWLGNKVTQQNLNNSTERRDEKINNIPKSIKGNQPLDAKKIAPWTKNNQGKQNIHVEKHNIQSIAPTHNKEKLLPPEVIHINTKVRGKFNHSKTSSTKVTQSVKKVKSVPKKIEDHKSTEEKVKNEILKLIGETPTSPKKKMQNVDNRLINKHRKTSTNVSSHVNKISPQNILQPKTILPSYHATTPKHQPNVYEPHILRHNKIHDNKFPQGQRKQKVSKASKTNTKAKSKKSFDMQKPPHTTPISSFPSRNKYRINSVRKQKTAPLLKKPITIKPQQRLAIPSNRHFKFPKIRKKPSTHINTNRVDPTTLPSVNANNWKGTFRNPYTPTESSIENWNRQNNVFDDEWKNTKWNSYGNNGIMQAPTVRPIISWNNMAWNSNTNRIIGYPNGGIDGTFQGIRPTISPTTKKIPLPINGIISGTDRNDGIRNTPRVLRPTLAPQYRQGEFPLNTNGGLMNGGKDGHSVLVTKPTIAPKYRQGQFPLTTNGVEINSRKDYWSQKVKIPYGGQVGSNPVSPTTPRRNYVYKSHNENKPIISPSTHVISPPSKPAGPQLTRSRTVVQPLANLTSLTPRKNAPVQPASTNNNYPRPNKVLSTGKIKSSQGRQSSKIIPKQVNILRRPTVPHRNTTKPKQWTTTRIQQPFKVNKIERLHGGTTTKAQLHPKVPKGCYPGEIMSEMTLENGLDAGNYTNLGPTELMDSCINKCCEMKGCEVAVQMDNVCFALECHSKDSCKIKSTLGKASHHKLCFISRKKKERQSIFDFGNDILGEQDMCPKQQAVGLSWKTTNAGTFDEIPCPKKAKGVAKRKCSIESHWLLPDFSSCVTTEYEDLYQRAKRLVYGEDSSSLLQSLAVVTTRTIDNSLIFGGDLKKTTEIMTSLVQEQGARQDGGMNKKDVKNYLITCSNLLDDSNKQEWRNIQKDARGSADILRDSQTYALIASSKLPEAQANVTYVTNNIVVQISYEKQGSKDKIFPDYTNPDVAMWDGEKDNIKLPASVFSIGNIKTATFSYKTLPALLPMDSNEHFRHSEPNSKILATIVEPRIQDKITPAVRITLHHLKQNRINPRCVYWDFNLNPTHGGAWSTEGCWLEFSAKEYTVCRCDHLANFAVVMDVVDTDSMQVSSKDERYSKEMAAMWICLPVLVVLIIAALYIASTWSRGPRRRTLSEKTSLLRSSITTDETRYDYSSTPSHNLEAATQPPSLEELEWHYKFEKHIMLDGHEMEHDSGIESNDHDDSSTHCDLSLSQDIQSPQSDIFEDYTSSLLNVDNTGPAHLDQGPTQENQIIHLDVERRIFSTNLHRCCGKEDLSK